MLKIRGSTQDGQPIVFLGLSEENIVRLLDGQPIEVDLNEMNLRGHIIIFAGKDEQSMMAELVGAAKETMPDEKFRDLEKDPPPKEDLIK